MSMGNILNEIMVFLLLLGVGFFAIIDGVSNLTSSVIIIGAGMSGISAAKTLSDAGINNFLILEATNHIGGRICKKNFAGINIEIGASWIEGVNGDMMNPGWEMAKKLNLRGFYSIYNNISHNTYHQNQDGGMFQAGDTQEIFIQSQDVVNRGEKLSRALPKSGSRDISILTFQRLLNKVPSTPLEMAVDYFTYDYQYANPPRVLSLQNSEPLPTLDNFGEDIYFVADQRGYELMVHDLAKQFLSTNGHGISDSRLELNKVVDRVTYTAKGVTVKTEDGSMYVGGYVILSPSIGVLQSNLIKFKPDLPSWKIMALYQFNMVVSTKIFLKFPKPFWPTANETNFFLYANKRRGYYTTWQHFEVEYPGANMLLVTVTDEESRRIEQQSDSQTQDEVMAVLRDMFGPNIPNATHILVTRWWSDRFYRGSFSNWPLGVNRHEYDQIKAPVVGRVYFTGEHTSEHYNGFVHGAYLAGIDTANMLIGCIEKGKCNF